ncbi:MAG: hypothetical protein Q8L13_25150 [Bradyrhizobium sp.]|uniref:hypothetical protein n=1 Tax=Bradyrhizobium sp. TaxID=376 RepID=UPI002730E4A6|nr:hypothetical protein [Bradyrhizobium sp.]MDP1869614.1 hypothetical protein [Bradyrhizobium sp.]
MIGIDIDGPDFHFKDEFDVETCEAIRAQRRAAPQSGAMVDPARPAALERSGV